MTLFWINGRDGGTRGLIDSGTLIVTAAVVAAVTGGVSGWTWLAALGFALGAALAAAGLYERFNRTDGREV